MHQNASTTVFMIPELAESILLQVGQSDAWKQLFVIQRVNRTFHSLIQTSPDLRRAIHLEQPDARRNPVTKFVDALETYKRFFCNINDLLYPFWTNTRPLNRDLPQAPAIAVSMNISLFWSEETPGITVGQPPQAAWGDSPIEKKESWRNLLVPYHPEHVMELHCCGYVVMVRFQGSSYTLGDLADEAVRAGKAHTGGIGRVMLYGQAS